MQKNVKDNAKYSSTAECSKKEVIDNNKICCQNVSGAKIPYLSQIEDPNPDGTYKGWVVRGASHCQDLGGCYWDKDERKCFKSNF